MFKSSSFFIDYVIGVHRDEGIFVAKWNRDSQKLPAHEPSRVSIYDIAPTIAKIFGKDIPADGKVVNQLVPELHS